MIGELLTTVAAVLVFWLTWEAAAFFVSHPVTKDGEPIRPPLSVGDYLWYNPGVLDETEN